MATLPAWALAIVLFTALCAGLAVLSILARTARNEVEVHAFKIRVMTLRAEYERTLKQLRGELEGEFDILEDEEDPAEIPIAEIVEADEVDGVEAPAMAGENGAQRRAA